MARVTPTGKTTVAAKCTSYKETIKWITHNPNWMIAYTIGPYQSLVYLVAHIFHVSPQQVCNDLDLAMPSKSKAAAVAAAPKSPKPSKAAATTATTPQGPVCAVPQRCAIPQQAEEQ